ncbi:MULTISPECIES: hypothetical protein [Streptomyces]|uniref:Uncharacterized protein n=1 Tax=Streptomyces thermoviolaceus subsp. thermoviolaceus TaxID=66860 RepID=A0ABX0YMR2_STRTL|nr:MULTISPECIES: hypothetical protein [Streptomyces]MCM3264284.1 hypothetical protein [Streptomyces thermoviolaceus]NJP13811.1 hypothetical protein [Streptomyces thermoviolaceus subsp. thermoviolaceus]RSS08394.1 hypothetical protein EF917_02450 [Streptomyces sp. WAC00469]WTD49435.1 hypothetical protein OG899_19135 [Streptomyces thermoviolaceus]GGV61143.1 hypothetical protein GCM10010499_02260 [Streptomyces thermoviolaceus subsp. apingens]
MPVPIRRLAVALTLCCALLAGSAGAATAHGDGPHGVPAATAVAAEPSPSTSQERQKFAKTRFVANAALAAGATYQWIWKPYKEGKFKKGAPHRRVTLVKAALAGAFAYNRLKAAVHNAQGDPTLSKALAPLNTAIAGLKDLPAKLRKGDGSAAGAFNDTINKVKEAGRSAGAPVKDKVPKPSELRSGS